MGGDAREKLTALIKTPDALAGIPDEARRLRISASSYIVKYTPAREVRPEQVARMFTLCEKNMRVFYEGCIGWGWKPKKKLKELGSHEARFLICCLEATAGEGGHAPTRRAAATATDIAAFMHLRFDMEGGEPLLYVYEVQVDAAHQGRGLGRLLMGLAEGIAWQGGLSRVDLTVFNANAAARHFYAGLGYVTSSDSPEWEAREWERRYSILTKARPPVVA